MTDSCESRSTFAFITELEEAWNRTTGTREINRIVEEHLCAVIEIDDLRVVRGLRCGRTYYATIELYDENDGTVEEPYTIEIPDSGLDPSFGFQP